MKESPKVQATQRPETVPEESDQEANFEKERKKLLALKRNLVKHETIRVQK